MEAMRDARPGMPEYELQADAEYIFKRYGAYGASYFALIATGTNTFYSHYHKNTARLRTAISSSSTTRPTTSTTSDVTRVFPGKRQVQPAPARVLRIYLACTRR